jgi:hypothetical protein
MGSTTEDAPTTIAGEPFIEKKSKFQAFCDGRFFKAEAYLYKRAAGPIFSFLIFTVQFAKNSKESRTFFARIEPCFREPEKFSVITGRQQICVRQSRARMNHNRLDHILKSREFTYRRPKPPQGRLIGGPYRYGVVVRCAKGCSQFLSQIGTLFECAEFCEIVFFRGTIA